MSNETVAATAHARAHTARAIPPSALAELRVADDAGRTCV
ncbi:DUF1203 domain-containing protein, partial [Streptomyces sp. SID6041]|nr:DUF1203 domain-containing protein [Streptomyces sp. SID6041]